MIIVVVVSLARGTCYGWRLWRVVVLGIRLAIDCASRGSSVAAPTRGRLSRRCLLRYVFVACLPLHSVQCPPSNWYLAIQTQEQLRLIQKI